jgi:hypothetical protein
VDMVVVAGWVTRYAPCCARADEIPARVHGFVSEGM